MADINLKQYLSRLDQHLQDGAFDEALYHSRHILKYFPKNIAAYRVLGRALLEEGRWQQAGEVLRRVLSVEPDNFDAFIGLSQVYERLKRPQEAIWYLERAFEQRPNSQALTRKLRDMYAEHYNRHVEKINLTAGAVARQYKSNGLYDQALDVLQRNLQRYPNRADLRILMARVYREAERPIEAAEVAQDLLEQLPDCLEANVLLAKVWLAVDRPSDAQRHISRIEPVAPYVALEIVQGGAPDEDAFMLPELDYQAVAARELASSSPDWLTSIEESEEVEATFESTEEVVEDISIDDDGDIAAWLRDDDSGTGLDENDDWLSEVESMDTKVNEAPTMPIPPPSANRERTGLTGLLAALEGDEAEEPEPQPDEAEISDDDFADLFEDLDNVPSSALADELRVDGIDLFADFEESDETINGEALDLFGDDDFELEDSEDDDPMAWLQESGVEFIEDFEDDDTVKGSTIDSSQLPSSDTADPMAWLKDSGVELVDRPDEFDAFLNEVDDLQDPEEGADPMAWLKNSGVEIIEESPSDEVDLFGDLDSGLLKDPTVQSAEDDDDDPMAWLKESGVELADEDVQALASDMPGNPEDELDWLADDDLLEEMLDIESFTNEEGFALEEVDVESAFSEGDNLREDSTESPERQDDMTENEFPDDWFDEESSEEWVGEQQPIYQLDESGEEEEDALDWMSDVQVEANAFTADTVQSSDEMDEEDAEDVVEPALFGDMETELSWENEPVSMQTEDAGEEDDDLPDWLVQDEAESEEEPVAFTAVGEDMEDEPFGFDLNVEDDEEEEGVVETTGEEAADWLSSLNMEDEESEEEDLFEEALADGSEVPIGSADEETPEWLMNNSPNFADSDGDDEEFSWELDSEEDDVPESTGEGVPDWLASVGDNFEETDDDAEEFEEGILAFGSDSGLSEDEEADFAWDGEDEDEEPESEGMPDWLTASAPNFGEDEDEEEVSAFGFESALSEDDEEWEDEGEEETPAWLSSVGNADEEEQEEPVVTSDGMPDWLSASAPDFEEEEEEEFEENVAAFGAGDRFGEDEDDEFAWDSEESDSAEEATPEWLSAVGASVEEDDEDDDFLELENEAEAEAGGVPDWLSGSAPEFDAEEDDEEFEEDVVAFGADASYGEDDDEFSWDDDEEVESLEEAAPEWLSAVGGIEETEEDEPSEGMPEWLSASAPGFATGEADEEDEELAWDDEEESYEEATPEWLASAAEDDDEEAIEGVVAYGAGEISPLDEDEYEEPVAFGAGDTVDQYGNEWESEEDEEDYEDAVPDWLASSAVEDVVEDEELLEDYEDNIVSFGAEDTILIDAQESGESLPLAEAPPLDDGLPVDDEDWQDEAISYGAEREEYIDEAVPLGDALPVQEDDYTESFAAAGGSNLLYEESRAGILDEESREYEASAREYEGTSVQPQSLNYDTIDEDQFVDESDEIDAVPADNAPDWLNTMVPGLDIDFEAAEDAPIETEYSDEFSTHRREEFVSSGGATRSETDLEWLTDIVDEETSQPPTLPGDDYLPAEALPDEEDEFDLTPEPQTRRRFVFSRPPLWLRRNKTEAQEVKDVEGRSDDFDFDDDMDEIGEDLPPWLDYDDDEF